MERVINKLGVVQNLSLVDRLFRFAVGIALIAAAAFSLIAGNTVVWQGFAILVSIYPLMTGMLGVDPIYSVFHKKTCGINDRNQCGTIPYQVDAAMGHHPIPDKGYEYEHSLDASHHEPAKQ